jgi:hypothetical protein
MLAMPDCCFSFSLKEDWQKENKPEPPPSVPIRSSTGLTAGNLLKDAQKLSESHRHCPYAEIWQHGDNGDVQVGAHFVGKISHVNHPSHFSGLD